MGAPRHSKRERKRLLAHIIEDVTLVKLPEEGTTKVHVRFKGGKIQTITTMNPKSSAQQIKTQPGIVELVDNLLNDHIYSEIADIPQPARASAGGSCATWSPGRPLHAVTSRLSRPPVQTPLAL